MREVGNREEKVKRENTINRGRKEKVEKRTTSMGRRGRKGRQKGERNTYKRRENRIQGGEKKGKEDEINERGNEGRGGKQRREGEGEERGKKGNTEIAERSLRRGERE